MATNNHTSVALFLARNFPPDRHLSRLLHVAVEGHGHTIKRRNAFFPTFSHFCFSDTRLIWNDGLANGLFAAFAQQIAFVQPSCYCVCSTTRAIRLPKHCPPLFFSLLIIIITIIFIIKSIIVAINVIMIRLARKLLPLSFSFSSSFLLLRDVFAPNTSWLSTCCAPKYRLHRHHHDHHDPQQQTTVARAPIFPDSFHQLTNVAKFSFVKRKIFDFRPQRTNNFVSHPIERRQQKKSRPTITWIHLPLFVRRLIVHFYSLFLFPTPSLSFDAFNYMLKQQSTAHQKSLSFSFLFFLLKQTRQPFALALFHFSCTIVRTILSRPVLN